MHNAAAKDLLLSIKSSAQKAFSAIIREMIRIYEIDEPVIPIIQSSEMKAKEHQYNLKVFTPLSPSWTLERIEISLNRLEENKDHNI